MKIALLTDGITPFVTGGMQRHSFNLTHHLLQTGHEVTLVHCVYGSARLPKKEEVKALFEHSKNLSVHTFRFPSMGQLPGHYLRESYQYSREIVDVLAKQWDSFDIVMAKGFSAWHLIEQKQKKKISVGPIAVNFHGVEMFQPPANLKERFKSYLLKGATKWNLFHADYCISYGGEITAIHEKLGIKRNKIVELPSGIDGAWVADTKKQHETPTFLFIGRYERRKGIEELTEVIKKNKSLNVHFIGNIPHTKRIKRDNVIYWGEIKDKQELQTRIDKCDVIVAPSFSEGMPNVLLEAMGRGLVPIATRVGAVAVLISEKEGFLLNPGNTEELANTLDRVNRMTSAERLALSNSTLSKVKEAFLWEKIIVQTEKAFHFMLENE